MNLNSRGSQEEEGSTQGTSAGFAHVTRRVLKAGLLHCHRETLRGGAFWQRSQTLANSALRASKGGRVKEEQISPSSHRRDSRLTERLSDKTFLFYIYTTAFYSEGHICAHHAQPLTKGHHRG